MNEAIQIFVRMRPTLQNEDEEAWRVYENSIVSIPRDPQTTRRYADAFYNYNFTFDRVFSTQENNEAVYQSSKALIEKCLAGYNASLFLYGQTTSGKTYTMLGDQSNPGILPFTLLELFKEPQMQYYISYIEIYNEQINDLLQVGATNLKMTDGNGFAQVPQLTIQSVQNFDEALNLLCFGEEQRCYREKQIHEHSSRSHTIFQIYMQHQSYQSILSLIDLAGSERLHEENVNDETAYINKSLFVLSNVINKLAEGKRTHIPYRDSKLTRYLQNSLGGNSFTTIICTISPASMNFNQTLSTLRFAQRAKKVENKIFKMKSMNQNDLMKEIQELKSERDQLKEQLKNQTYTQQSSINSDLLIAYIANQTANDKQQFYQDVKSIQDDYYKQQEKINNEFYQNLIQLGQIEMNDCSINNVANQFKEQITKQIEQESIFNNVYVQSILNPTQSTTEFQQYETEELLALLQQAYEEAYTALKGRMDEVYHYIDLITQYRIKSISNVNESQFNENSKSEHNWMNKCKTQLNDQLQRKLNVLQQAFQNVQRNLRESSTKDEIKQQDQRRTTAPTPKFTDRDKSELFVWGSGKDGRLGTGTQLSQATPLKIINTGQSFQTVSCGYYHSAAINFDGDLYVWGKVQSTPILQPLLLMGNVQQVACGWQHSLILSNGCVFSWGQGEEGQLGHGIFQNSSHPKQILKIKDAVFVAAGHSHSGVITKENECYLWGCNIDRRLGLANTCNINTPTKLEVQGIKLSLGANHSGVITPQNQCILFGNNSSGQLGCMEKSQNTLQNIIEVACGEDFTILLQTNGDVLSCGKKSNGTLGHLMGDLPTLVYEPLKIKQLKKIKKIAVGKRHCLAINALLELYCWGFNFYDQLGLGDRNRFIETPIKLESLQDVMEVACGEYHSLALCQA